MAGHPLPEPATVLPPPPPPPGGTRARTEAAQARIDKLAEVALYAAVEHWADMGGVYPGDVCKTASMFLSWLRSQQP